MQQQQTQQQTQYPSYQAPTDGMYAMAEQHVGMTGMSDMNTWSR